MTRRQRHNSPSVAVGRDQYLLLRPVTQPVPPAVDVVSQPVGGANTIPLHDGPANAFVTVNAFKVPRYRDPEAPVIKADLRPAHIRRFDN